MNSQYVHVLFLFGNDNLVCEDWLSRNWESTRSHIDDIRLVEDSFGVDLTLFFAPLVNNFLGCGDHIVSSEKKIADASPL